MTQYFCSCTRLIYSRVVAHPKIFWHKLQMQIPCLEPCHLFDSVWMTLMPLLTSTLCASYSHCIPQASLNSRLRIKVHIPYESLQSLVTRLQQFQQASGELLILSTLCEDYGCRWRKYRHKKVLTKVLRTTPFQLLSASERIVDDKERAWGRFDHSRIRFVVLYL